MLGSQHRPEFGSKVPNTGLKRKLFWSRDSRFRERRNLLAIIGLA